MIKLINSTFYHEKETKEKLCEFITKSSQLSFGAECQRFEQNFAFWQGRKESVFLNSGSSANLAIFQALLNLGKLRIGDKVGFSALTWSTNPMPIFQLGLKPIPIDVEIETLNVSSKKLLQTLKEHQIRCLLLTNLLGFCDDIEKIKEICDEQNIILLEDNCEALGSIYQGKKLGNFGLASTFSFFVGHHMSTIEGGAIATDDPSLATMLRMVRAHGWDRNLSADIQSKIRSGFKIDSEFYSKYTFYDLGFNLRPTEITAFIGNLQLLFLTEVIYKRNANFKKVSEVIYSQSDKYFPIKYSHIEFLSNFAVPVACRTSEIRDELVKKCEGKLEIRPIVGGDMTKQPFFKKYNNEKLDPNLNAETIHNLGLYFGNNPEMTDKELDLIIKIFT